MAERMTTRAEWPWIAGGVVALLALWWAADRWLLAGERPDPTEGGRFAVVRYATDVNPSRNEQVAIFNRYHAGDGVQVQTVPAGGMQALATASAARTAPDVVDLFLDEDLRTLARKGIARPLNEHLKRTGLDLATTVWPERLDAMRLPNPDWRPGDHPFDRHIWYAVPNNVSTEMVWFNRSLYLQACAEIEAAGGVPPREPWVGWTWWDYAALGRAMHRRIDGRFASFGCAQPDVENLALQAGLSMRGTDRAAWERASPALSWDDCVAGFRRTADGGFEAWPNRAALADALGFRHDLVHVFAAAPSPTDAGQMQTSGGFVGAGTFGQFKAGRLGLLIAGRWFLGQVRGDVAFDWRLVRMPRWVPYAEWDRWESQGLAPSKRDGPWGEGVRELRGAGTHLGGRLAILTSSARDPQRAFAFLAFLVGNREFNDALLAEDGMGANAAMARAYLAGPDPRYPGESVRRTPEHELAAVASLHPRLPWPYANASSARAAIFGNIDSDLNRTFPVSGRGVAVERLAGPGAQSDPAVGAELARRASADAARALEIGRAIDEPRSAGLAPSGATWTAIAVAIVLAGGAAVMARRRRSVEPA